MRQICALNIEPSEHLGMALRLVWMIDADSTYYMQPTRDGEKWLAAIRTIGGHGAVEVKGYGRFELEEDSLIFIDVNLIREYKTVGQHWDFYWFEFTRDGGIGYPWHEVLTVLPYRWEETVVQHTFNLLWLPDILSRTAATCIFDGLLHDWASRWERFGEKPNALRDITFNAISLIQKDLSRPVNFRRIADELNISERWLYHAFINIVGVSPRTYYSDLRMQQAAHALSMRLGTITQIADRLGYSNPFHFSRAFKAKYGCSPSDYVRFYGNIPE